MSENKPNAETGLRSRTKHGPYGEFVRLGFLFNCRALGMLVVLIDAMSEFMGVRWFHVKLAHESAMQSAGGYPRCSQAGAIRGSDKRDLVARPRRHG
jgi:hypothetical protein